MGWGVTLPAKPAQGWDMPQAARVTAPWQTKIPYPWPDPPLGRNAGQIGFNTAYRNGPGYWGWGDANPSVDFPFLVSKGVTWLREIMERRFIETADGVDTWATYDAIMDAAAEAGLNYLWCVSTTPEWDRPNGAVDHYNTPPQSNAKFAQFVKRVADRYGPNGTFWAGKFKQQPITVLEIWNEPWGWFAWRPDPVPADYAALALATGQVMQTAHPDIELILDGSLYVSTSGGDTTSAFSPTVLAAQPTLKDYYAIFGVHPYVIPRDKGPHDTSMSFTTQFQRLATARDVISGIIGRQARVWVTEYGNTNATANVSTPGMSEAAAATAMRDALHRVFDEFRGESWRAAIEMFFIHMWWASVDPPDLTDVEGNYMVMRDDGSFKPAWAEIMKFTSPTGT